MPKSPSDFPLIFGGGSLNLRNGYARGSDMPLQFESQPAKCRLYYTRANILDPTTSWVDAADAIWGGKSCVAVEASHGPVVVQAGDSPGGGQGNGGLRSCSSMLKILAGMFIGAASSLI
jgi:hypothetical protein